MGLIQEFKDFAMKGNVVDMAVGVVIGGAFGKIVASLVADIISPILGYITGGVSFEKWDSGFGIPKADGTYPVTLPYGKFMQASFDFLIVALALFAVIKIMNEAKKRFEKKAAEAPPPAPPADVVLLKEIRDLLAKR